MTRINIRDLNHSGEGVGLIDKKVCFVPGLLPGEEALIEIVQKKKNFMRGRLVEILVPSPHRIEGGCEHSEDCGGCPLINLDYKEQFRWKLSFAKKSFEKMAKVDIDFEDLYPAEESFHYRNKLTLFLEDGRLGLRRPGSHKLAPIKACKLGDKSFDVFYPLLEGRRDLHSVILRRADKGGMLILIGEKPFKDEGFLDELMAAGAISIYHSREKKEDRSLSGKLIHLRGEKNPIFTVMDRKFSLTPRSFFQVNKAQADKLYKLVEEYLKPEGDERLLDLYSGQGTLGAYLAPHVEEVLGVEVVGEAVSFGKKSLPNNMSLIHSRVEDLDLPQMDSLIVDPPRAGLSPLVIKKILEISPEKIVYVSCNPVTQARDIALLDGYRVERAGLVDMFPNTAHVETVVLMSRVDK